MKTKLNIGTLLFSISLSVVIFSLIICFIGYHVL